MGNNRLNRLLSRVVSIKPGEETLVVLLFSCFFLITAPHTIIKALRYADLLQKMGPEGLPLAYLSAAVVTGLVVLLHSKIRVRFSGHVLMISSLVFFVVTGLVLHIVLQTDVGSASSFLSYVYWVWAGVLVTVLVTQFWLIVIEVFNPREAKRLIGFCGSGGILGGILGGLLAGFFTRSNLSNGLLPLACGLLLACIFVVRAIFVLWQRSPSLKKQIEEKNDSFKSQKFGFRDSFNAVRRNKYLGYIAVLIVISVVVSTFIDFHFSTAVHGVYFTKEGKQAFFGLFYAGLTTFAFFLNILLTHRLLKSFRIRFTLLLTPIALFVGSLLVLFAPFALLPAIVIKGSDESLGFSLQQSVRELLYIPVSSELKLKAKPFIDMFINRFAKVLAALLLFVFALTLEKEVEYLTPILDPGLARDLLWGVIAFLILWIILNLKIYKEYIDTVRQNIKVKWRRGDKLVTEKVDVDYTRLIFDTIESKNRSSVLYAMHLFDLLEQDKLTPEIKAMISQKTDEVKASSLADLFNAEGATWFPEIADDVSQKALITDIREIMSSENYQRLMDSYAERVIAEEDASEIGKMELAKMIGLMSAESPVVEKLDALIIDESAEVSRYAIQSAARLKKDEHIPSIIEKLSHPLIHEEAVSALKSYGHSALNLLQAYLCDSSRPIETRKDVAKVLAQIGNQEAVQILLDELDKASEELDTAVIDALDRVRAEREDIHFSAKFVQKKILSVIKKYCQTTLELASFMPSEQNSARARQLLQGQTEGLAQIFKLLGLYYPREDIVKAYQNLQADTKDSVAYAIELLDNTLIKEMKDIVLPLIEDLSPSEREREFRRILRNLG
ncbi:MAG: Npt1/Npt2 family nucleotide transporter [Candidatus Aminicenantes bacterium]|jgi:AAA family ATP:ADP antiporter